MYKLFQAIRSHISYKIILPYLALTLLVTLVGAVVSLGLAAASWEDRLMMLLTQMGRDTSDALVQRERDHLIFLRQVAGAQANPAADAPAMGAAFAKRDPAVLGRALKPFYDFQAENDSLSLDRVIAFDAQGQALIDWLRVSDERGAAPQAISGTDLALVPEVQSVLAGKVIDGSDKFSGLIRFGTDPQPYFYTVVGVRDGAQIVGGLLVGIKTDRMLQGIQRSTQAVVTAIYDGQGQPTSATLRRDQIGELKPLMPRTLTLLGGGTQSVFDRTGLLGRDAELAYSPLLIAGRPAGFFAVGLWRDAEFSWLLINRNGIIAIAMTLAAGAVILGFWIARHITAPLGALVETAEAVTSGDLARRTPVSSPDEFGRLAQAFNQMTEHLLRLYQVSRDLNTTIEVAEVLDLSRRALQPLLPDVGVLALIDRRGERGAWRYVLPAGAPAPLQSLEDLAVEPDAPALAALFERRSPYMAPPQDAQLRQDLGLAGRAETGGLLLVPLLIQENAVGLLLFSHTRPDAFSGALEPTLLSVAGMAASVLCNAVLFARVQHEASERQAILHSLADGVVVCDTHGTILLANPAAERMLDLADRGFQRRRFRDLPLEPTRVGQELFAADHSMEHYRLGQRVLGLSRAPVARDDGAMLGEVIVLHDLSAEAAVDRAKTTFIETISHELRTPLTVITGYTELLLRGLVGDLTDEQRDLLQHVRGRAEDINSLVKNVILVASIEAGTLRTEREPQDVACAVEQVAGSQRRMYEQKGLALHLRLPPDLPPVCADSEQLRVVLEQLLDNARRYTPHGGATVSAERQDDTVVIHVSDSGPGIAPGDLERLFTRFYRIEGNSSPERGSGLGLAIARQLVERQGGQVWATSTIGEGSTFSVALPVAHGHNHTFTENNLPAAEARLA